MTALRLRTAPGSASARRRRLTALLALSLLPAALAGVTNDRVLYQDDVLQVVSPDGASVEQARAAAREATAAWTFDLNLMRWADPAAMQRPFTLRLVSDDRLARERPGSRAYAVGNAFTVGLGLTGDASINGTFAHELGHLQAFRVLGGRSVPHYFLEGHGLMMNQLYSDHLGLDRHAVLADQARTILSLTAEEARTILTDEERSRKDPNMESMGLFFVEYLRVRKTMPDAVPRMGRVFELVGRSRTYAQAFGHVYGLSLQRTVSEIVAFLHRTAAHPAERLKGTRFEQYAPGATAPAPRQAPTPR
jgi:hypothetical protein